MAATIIGTAISFGTAVSASGVIVNSASLTKNAQKAEIVGPEGNVVAVSFYGKTNEISIEGSTNGSVTAAVASTLSVSGFAITGSGAIRVESVDISASPDGFKQVSISATQFPSI